MRLLTYSLVLMVFLSTVGLSWMVDNLYQYNANADQDIDKVKLFEQLGENLGKALKNSELRHSIIAQWQGAYHYQLAIEQLNSVPLPAPLMTEIQSKQFLLLTSDNELSYYYLLSPLELMRFSAPISLFESNQDNNRFFYTLLFYLLLTAAFLLWAYPLLQRLTRLRKSAKAFGSGELSQRMPYSQFSYIRDIEQEFNHMAQRIEDLIADVKLLGNAVSHELRTPLARIRFGLDTLAEEEDPVLRQQYQNKINANLDEMTNLVDSLLNYARTEQAMRNIKSTPVNIFSLLQHLISPFATGDNELTLVCSDNITKAKSIQVLADEKFLIVLFNNLINNALRYGQGQVLIELIPQQNQVVIAVHDNGNGVLPKDADNIFKPFIRGTDNTNAGYGLGLAIAKRIVDWHKGEISVKCSSHLNGAQFNVTFPIFR